MAMAGGRALARNALAGLALIAAFGGAATAEQRHAHVHGAAKLNVAIEAGEIWLELEAPAVDIVGFEHMPETAADHAAVEAAAELLHEGPALYSFPEAAGCRPIEAEVASALIESGESAGHDHGKAEHAHDKDEHGSGHAEFVARHRFRCEDPSRLDSVDLELFQLFQSLKDVDATVIAPTGQKAAELTRDQARLKF